LRVFKKGKLDTTSGQDLISEFSTATTIGMQNQHIILAANLSHGDGPPRRILQIWAPKSQYTQFQLFSVGAQVDMLNCPGEKLLQNTQHG
jgi:hypothetical protein